MFPLCRFKGRQKTRDPKVPPLRSLFSALLVAVGLPLGLLHVDIPAYVLRSKPATAPLPAYWSGYDVSFPQCRSRFPAPSAFAIVGVNGGSAHTNNQCMRRELAWAHKSSGFDGYAGAQLYVNTENPGRASQFWPRSNRDPVSGYKVADRYGICTGKNTEACAWQYGWNAAETDVIRRGVSNPLTYAWWLDVETDNLWQPQVGLNRADLTGMVDFFQSQGMAVGVYSTWVQWPEIVGTVGPLSPLRRLPQWISGASTKAGAKSACAKAKFMSGAVEFSQWYNASSTFDGDIVCPQHAVRTAGRR